GVQTCALPIYSRDQRTAPAALARRTVEPVSRVGIQRLPHLYALVVQQKRRRRGESGVQVHISRFRQQSVRLLVLGQRGKLGVVEQLHFVVPIRRIGELNDFVDRKAARP